MTKTAAILALAKTGKTARQIAEAVGCPIHSVYRACYDAGQMLTLQHSKISDRKGTIPAYARMEKRSGHMNPTFRISTAVLRRAGLHTCERIAFEVADGVITLRKPEPKEPV